MQGSSGGVQPFAFGGQPPNGGATLIGQVGWIGGGIESFYAHSNCTHIYPNGDYYIDYRDDFYSANNYQFQTFYHPTALNCSYGVIYHNNAQGGTGATACVSPITCAPGGYWESLSWSFND